LHPAQLTIEELLASCQVRTLRRSGPGGQHRNKVETAVVIEHRPTGVAAEANERRSQQANREVAIQRLRLKLATEIRSLQSPKPNSQDASQEIELPAPSEMWKKRVKSGRVEISSDHAEYPAILAELLDRLLTANWNVSTIAEVFQVTSSQLVKVLRKHPPAMLYLNEQRKLIGLGFLQ
jgi:protein subunit release factor A